MTKNKYYKPQMKHPLVETKSYKNIVVFVIILVSFIGGLGSCYLYISELDPTKLMNSNVPVLESSDFEGTSQSNLKITPILSPSPTLFPVDTENDGVYTNYEYGFRFEYSIEIFNSYGWKDPVMIYREESDGGYPEIAIMPYISKKNFIFDIYKSKKDLEIGEYLYPQGYLDEINPGRHTQNYEKIRDFSTQGHAGVLVYSFYIGGDTEPSYGYVAYWKMDSSIYRISVISPDQTQKDNLLEIINRIIASMKFFEPVIQ